MAGVMNDIVISGIDCRLPKSKNMDVFGKNLFSKVDMTTEDHSRWTHEDFPLIPMRAGIVDGLEKFDAGLFKIHSKLVDAMDPQMRFLLELVYATMLDAGVHPASLRGSNTGVFTATCYDDMMGILYNDPNPNDGFLLTGSQSVFLSNRISYAFDLKGPSFTLDSACSSSMYAILLAVNAMRLNQCDAAIVCGANLQLNPILSTHLAKLGVLSPNGQCLPFDNAGAGYLRADGIASIFLQKRKDANRVYADLLHILGNNDGFKSSGITSPSWQIQNQLFSKLYDEIKVDHLNVKYVEAHVTGTKVGDAAECSAIDSFFNQNRTEPLLVGGVKSNMGHNEASSGLSQVAKVIHSFESNMIPATIKLTKLREDIPALVEGRMKVCTENTPLPGPLIAINSFGFGGANAHALLRQWHKEKDHSKRDAIPRLVVWSGRTEEAVSTIIDKVKSIPMDREFIGLLHNIQNTQVTENFHLGYGVFEDTGSDSVPLCVSEDSAIRSDTQRPVVWMFSGMGCQWAGMGKSLMQLSICHESIVKCHNVLKPFNIDVIDMITTDDESVLNKIENAFIGITTIQIALVDLLRTLEVPVDYMIGHSNGELLCAYTDGAQTLEQTVLTAYYKGRISIAEKTNNGLMAAIGLGYNQLKNRIPASIDIACHNSAESSTISGLRTDVLKFIEQLKSENIFAKDVMSDGIAYHSRHVAPWLPKLLKHVKTYMPNRSLRSSKWISSSVPSNQWDTEKGKYNSAEYIGHNFANPVLFEEACTHLPTNAIVIEIAPHGLLQPILRKSLPNAINVSLAKRNNSNNLQFLMNTLGNLFLNGLNLQIDRMYPKVNFPVSRGTPMIAPLIKYDHEQDWYVPSAKKQKSEIVFDKDAEDDNSKEDNEDLANYTTEGELLENYEFIPLIDRTVKHTMTDAIRICVQLVIEKLAAKQLSIVEVVDDTNNPVIDQFRDAVLLMARVDSTYKLVSKRNHKIDSVQIESSLAKDQSKYTIAIENRKNVNVAELVGKLSPGGCVIVVNDSRKASDVIPPEGCTLVSVVQTQLDVTFSIFQRNANIVNDYRVISIRTEDREISWLKVVQAIKPNENVILLADRDNVSGILGLFRSLRFESILNIKCVIIDDKSAPTFDVNNPLYRTQLSLDLPINILRDGQWGTYRHLILKPKTVATKSSVPLSIQIKQVGNSQTIEWVPVINGEPNRERIQVRYTGMNMLDKDVPTLGIEYSGIDSNGNRVMGTKFNDSALATEISCLENDFKFEIPQSISLEEAATIPIAYLSVYSAFFIGNEISREQSIYIHDGSNNVSLAAIQVALSYGLQVFTTVSSQEQKAFLLRSYPSLKESNIGITLNQKFVQNMISATNGVDFVVHALKKNQMEESSKCLCEGGTLLAIEISIDESLAQMINTMLTTGLVVKTVSLQKLAKRTHVRNRLTELITKDLKSGIIKPLPSNTIDASKLEEALSSIEETEISSKRLIQMPPSEEILKMKIKPRFVADPKAVYIIAGGLGNLGLELVNWMTTRGAMKFVLNSRYGIKTAYQQKKIDLWSSRGCMVMISTDDITSTAGCRTMLEKAIQHGPIHGIFNLAAVFLDAIYTNLTVEQYKNSLLPKAYASLHLDELSRELCPQLEHFVLFSSIASGRGTGGQVNYAHANSIAEKITENRIKENLPAKSIQWGPVARMGLVTKLTNNDVTLEVAGYAQMPMDRCLLLLDDLLFSDCAIVSITKVPAKKVDEGYNLSSLMKIFRIKDIHKIPASTTLLDLGMDSLIVSDVKQVLYQETNLSFSTQELQDLTIGELRKISSAN